MDGDDNTDNSTPPKSERLNYIFNGGSLEDLESVSPSLEFGDLTIDGDLTISSLYVSVTLAVNNLYINAKVESEFPNCKRLYNDGPDLTINAVGTVEIGAPINLMGEAGKTSSNNTCKDCGNGYGGDLTINAENIYVDNAINLMGGDAGSNWSQVPGLIYECGCDGGGGGTIKLSATNILDIRAGGANQRVNGGEGGKEVLNCKPGEDGDDGNLLWKCLTITVYEINGDTNMSVFDSQLLDYRDMTLYGNVSLNEELNHRNENGSIRVKLSEDIGDWIEDFYLIDVKNDIQIQIKLAAENPNADLDLYLLKGNFTKIIDSSNGSSSSEDIKRDVSTGKYLVGVSYSDDGLDLTTNCTLHFGQ